MAELVGRLIPFSIQAGTATGIGLLTALAGATDISLVEQGSNGQLLQMGAISNAVIIAISGVIIICIFTHYHITVILLL